MSFSGAWCHSLRCGRGHVDGFFPPRALRCLDFSEPRRGGQAGPANLKLFLEEGRAAFAVLWNPNAFSCRPDKITGLLSRQRSDFPRNQPRSPGSSRLAVRSLRVSAVKPDSLPGMHTRPSCDRAGPFRPTTLTTLHSPCHCNPANTRCLLSASSVTRGVPQSAWEPDRNVGDLGCSQTPAPRGRAIPDNDP